MKKVLRPTTLKLAKLTTRSALAPFYARARRRRIWRVLRWLLLISGLIILVAMVALATSWLPF